MDNFYTASPVLTLAHGLFESTDAVVRADNVRKGMRRIHRTELPWSDERKKRAQQIVCWYKSTSLHVSKSARENVAVLQGHLDALALERRLLL